MISELVTCIQEEVRMLANLLEERIWEICTTDYDGMDNIGPYRTLDFRLTLVATSGHEMFLPSNATMQKTTVVWRKGSRVRY